MKTSIQLPCKHCLDNDLLTTVKDAGFDGVDVSFTKDLFQQENWEAAVDSIRRHLDDAGLTCPQVHLPYYDIFTPSETYDEEMEKRIHFALQSMKTLGAKWGAHHPMSATNHGFDVKRGLEDNITKISGYLETAAKYNVGIAIENLPVFARYPKNRFFASHVEEHCELIDRLHSPLVGACWDFGHANLVGCDDFGRPMEPAYDKIKALEVLGDRVKIIHAHDNFGDYDFHHCPTIGTVNWYALIPILLRHNFPGYFSLECEQLPGRELNRAYLTLCGKTAVALLAEIEAEEAGKEKEA